MQDLLAVSSVIFACGFWGTSLTSYADDRAAIEIQRTAQQACAFNPGLGERDSRGAEEPLNLALGASRL